MNEHMWNPSTCVCECNKACKIDKCLHIKNCSCKKLETRKCVSQFHSWLAKTIMCKSTHFGIKPRLNELKNEKKVLHNSVLIENVLECHNTQENTVAVHKSNISSHESNKKFLSEE